MPIPPFIKKKIDASAEESEDSSTADSSTEDSSSPAEKGKQAARAKNPLMQWAQARGK